MTKRLGIDLLTVFGMPPVEHVTLAANLGCSHISTGLTAVPWKLDGFPHWSLRDDLALRREMIAVLRDRGVSIALVEGFTIRPGIEARHYAADLDLSAKLEARRANTICMEPDQSRARDQLAALAELTAERGMGLTLEFAPPHAINTLEKALSALCQVGKQNVSLVIDAMHFFRSGGSVAELAEVDPHLIGYVQLCDVPLAPPHEDYFREACFDRQCPGEGELPLDAFLLSLPHDAPIGLEIPMLSRVKAGERLTVLVERAVDASHRLLDGL
jgi:sugar phosphate isomerase/epimerase